MNDSRTGWHSEYLGPIPPEELAQSQAAAKAKGVVLEHPDDVIRQVQADGHEFYVIDGRGRNWGFCLVHIDTPSQIYRKGYATKELARRAAGRRMDIEPEQVHCIDFV